MQLRGRRRMGIFGDVRAAEFHWVPGLLKGATVMIILNPLLSPIGGGWAPEHLCSDSRSWFEAN
jgi:hypothetical protein